MIERLVIDFVVLPSLVAAGEARVVGDLVFASGDSAPVTLHVNEARRLRDRLTEALALAEYNRGPTEYNASNR